LIHTSKLGKYEQPVADLAGRVDLLVPGVFLGWNLFSQ
jgi:hypothetical protein